ncbi:MAG: M23 family metallopeptidase [Candidatus Binatia bacterium]
MKWWIIVIVAAGFGQRATSAQEATPKAPAPAQVQVEIVQPPTPMSALGKADLVYELHLTNFNSQPLTLSSIAVSGPHAAVTRFEGEALARMIEPIGVAAAQQAPLILEPGRRSIAFMWLTFPSLAAVPPALSHQLTFEPLLPDQPPLQTNVAPAAINQVPLMVIGPPLQGSRWLARNGPSNRSTHRRALRVAYGKPAISQRYAIDWVQLGADGRTYAGDETRNESYHCYGADVLAVAAGRVVDVNDGIPENTPHSGKTAVPINFTTEAGNGVSLDLGSGRYAMYAHLIPGSITVQVGDMVERGQVLGKVGNAGNATEPSLHFHIADGPSFVAAEGVPYAFDSVKVRAGEVVTDPSGSEHIEVSGDGQSRALELVLENSVVDFGGHPRPRALPVAPAALTPATPGRAAAPISE